MQPEVPVVVVDDIAQGGEAAVVVVAPLAVRPEPLERRGAVVAVRRAVGLEGVDADLRRCVAVPARLGVEGRHVASGGGPPGGDGPAASPRPPVAAARPARRGPAGAAIELWRPRLWRAH